MRILIVVGRVLLNSLIYGFGFLACTSLLYAEHSQPLLMCVAFLVASVVVGLWSKWWEVVVPAGLGFLWGLGAFKWAIHLTDTRGEYAPPILQYVFSPSPSELLWSISAAVSAGVGWWISTVLRSRSSRSPLAGR